MNGDLIKVKCKFNSFIMEIINNAKLDIFKLQHI
jgi:hypothetical protein